MQGGGSYDNYCNCIKENMKINYKYWEFKSQGKYNTILEHVDYHNRD